MNLYTFRNGEFKRDPKGVWVKKQVTTHTYPDGTFPVVYTQKGWKLDSRHVVKPIEE
jgi:hypothetical protein